MQKRKGLRNIYLDAQTHTCIEEVGAANFFCVKDGGCICPELTGTTTEITRGISFAGQTCSIEVHETKVTAEFAAGADEAFCCGTAAVISPIGSITHGNEKASW